jgi:hypothetical protein
MSPQKAAMAAAQWFRAYHQERARALIQDRTLDFGARERASLAEYKAAAVFASYAWGVA